MNRGNRSPQKLAARAGLHYATDEQPGIRRRRRGRGFSYGRPSGRLVRSREELQRIESLAIPPAWNDVWIACDKRNHLQATGRDAKGRKQFLYHPRWQEASNLTKFDRLADLGDALPRIRRRVGEQLRKRTLGREKTLALVVRLLDLTGMRIGNEEYAAENGSYGLTTLRRRHLRLNGASAEFRFPGKSRQRYAVTVNDGETLRALKACAAEPTGFLFGYRGEDGPHIVDSNEVNGYLREISSSEVTAKDMRTWLASARAAAELYSQRDIAEHGKRKSALVEVVKTVAQQLGNTPTVCRNSYLHPRLLAAFEAGEFLRLFANFRCRKLKWLRREDQILRHALARL